MDRWIAYQVAAAYTRRNKGCDDETFVDHTRNGAYLEVNRATGTARQISAEAWARSPHRRFVDGDEIESSSDDDRDDD
jgi:hypothetical protein